MAVERDISRFTHETLPHIGLVPEVGVEADIAEIPETAQTYQPDTNGTSEQSVSDIRLQIEEIYSDTATTIDDHSLLANGTLSTDTGVIALQTRPIEKVETEKKPKFEIREATAADLDSIVEVDMEAFEGVYRNYETPSDQLREELREKFAHRLELVGGQWMPVLEMNGKIVGFMTCCPTSKTPEEFQSWEETTDNGTLETTYDPKGKNGYIVTLSVLKEGTEGKDMLFANQIGRMFRAGIKLGFFESRLPGLREWVVANKLNSVEEADVSQLDPDMQMEYAEEYFGELIEVNGKEVRRDRLVRLYERIGCRADRVVANAYSDQESMNFGVVCIYDGSNLFDGSTLPFKLPDNRLTRWGFGLAMTQISKSQKLTKKVMG